jgi:hypothetical protein
VRDLVRALQRVVSRGAWDGDRENLEAAQALFTLMGEDAPDRARALSLLRTIDDLPAVGEMTLMLQRAARTWYQERFSPSSARRGSR